MTTSDGSDYRVIETLGETRGEKLYRAHDRAGRSVVLKVLGSDGPEARQVERLENEFRIAAKVGTLAVVRPIALDRFRGYPTLVLEDVAGSTLDHFAGPIELGRFLRLAVAAASALEDVHRHGVIHKDLKPPNILVEAQGDQVRLSGFGNASVMPRELQVARNPTQIEGTLAYMSPEQTGRTHRALDSRTDLYSLGVTFYEMLTGRLPFSAADPMGWVHCHIARAPTPPDQLVPSLPQPVSLIVMKLLAKPAEDRYQSAAGLRYDLELCDRYFSREGRIPSFALATRDVWDRLQIPEKLYGRQMERAALLAAFDRVVAQHQPQLVLLTGAGGIGKSTLGHELEAAVVRERGVFLSGKFAPYQRNVPYATIIEALRGLLADILTESDEEIAAWRRRLGEALGANAQLMIDLLPALELVLGKQPPPVDLPTSEDQLRFAVTLQKLIAALPHPDRPVVLFLDDLQWADASSLELLHRAALHPGMGPLLLVGTYRSDEPVAPELQSLIEQLRQSPVPVEELPLAPLPPGALGELIADSLHCSAEEAAPLAAMVHDKTGGNPFFATQFLMELWQEGLLILDRTSHGWQWELAEIAAKGFTSNVVDFMVAKVKRLPASTQSTLRLAACLGRPFDTRALAALAQEPELEIEAALLPAVEEGLVLYTDGHHRFAHDRIREAACRLLSDEERPAVHLRIGRWLLAGKSPGDLGDELFDAANQLNRAGALIDDPGERLYLAEVNLVTGRRAMAAHGPAAAVAYLGAGLAALGEDRWTTSPDLTRQLLLARAECQVLCSVAQAALVDCDELIARARTRLERAAPYRLKQEAHMARGEFTEAAQAGIERLSIFGIHLPQHPTWEDALAERERVRRLMRDRPMEALLELPRMDDPEMVAAVGGLPPMAFLDPNLFCVFNGRMVALTLEHGLCDVSVQWFVTYAFALASAFDEPVEARRLAELAQELTERWGIHAQRPVVLIASTLVHFWTDPVEEYTARGTAALEAARQIGAVRDLNFATLLVARGLLAQGESLDRVAREADRLLPLARSPDARENLMLIRQFARALQGQTASLGTFDEDDFDEAPMRASGPRPTPRRAHYWVLKLRAAFLAGDLPEALEASAEARALSRDVAGQIASRDFHLFSALTLAALHPQQSPELRETWLTQIREHERRLRRWSSINPRTFRPNLALVGAELARLTGRSEEASRLFDESVRWAQEGHLVHDEALAHERAAAFLRSTGREEEADHHLCQAREAYARWGATGKVKQLERELPHRRIDDLPAQEGGPIASEQLDLLSVVKASQAISGEVVLERLLTRLMEVVLEHSGAERACVLLPDDGVFKAVAEARVKGGHTEVVLRGEQDPAPELPASLVQYVSRTGERVVLHDACAQGRFVRDAYVMRARPRSVLGLPVCRSAEVVGLLYFENSALGGLFTPGRLAALELLAAQAAISLEHARLIQQERAARATAEEARQRVEQAVRARDEFLHIASHELNTPLAALLLNLDALKNLHPANHGDVDLLMGMAAVTHRQGLRLSRLVRELLDATRIDRGSLRLSPVKVELGALVREVLTTYAAELEQARCPVAVEQSEPVVGWWDVERLHQLLLNLLSNAAKFGPARPIEIRIATCGERARLSVTDHGIGIAPEGRARLFERYQRGVSAEHYGGLGLGLHICSHIVQAHGGSISVESEPGKGATFTVELPHLAR